MKQIQTIVFSLLIIIIMIDRAQAAFSPKPSYFNKAYIGGSVGLGMMAGSSKYAVTSNGTPPSISPNSVSVSQSLNEKARGLGILGGLNAGYNIVFDSNRWLIGIDTLADMAKVESKTKTIGALYVNTQFDASNKRISTLPTPPSPSPSLLGDTTNGFIQSKVNMKWSVGAGTKFGRIINGSVLLYVSTHWIGSQWQIKNQAQQPLSAHNGPPLFDTQGTFNTVKKSRFKNGLRVGLGIATPITNNLITGLDIGYTWYGKIKSSNTTTVNVSDQGAPYIDPRQVYRDSIITTSLTNSGSFSYTTTATSKHSPRLIDIKLKLAWQFNGIS